MQITISTRLRGRVVLALILVAMIRAGLPILPAVAMAQTAALIIHNDQGGSLAERRRQIRELQASGRAVELRGTCYSACTMYLGAANVCVTPAAVFGFHGPSWYGKPLSPSAFEHWSQVMASNYREPLRSWFLTTARYQITGYYRLSGAELIRLGYPRC